MPLLANGRTGIIPLQHSTPLIFSHVSIPTKLIIETGASSIQWEYVLNTNIIPTYGGEVGQILSATVEAMTITGQTRNNNQLKDIYDWFLQYMQLAGLHNREEQAIKFSYPERGWEFYIQVNQAPNFQYNRDIIATPWQIQAEIVADNDLNYLSGYTMSLVGEAVTFDPTLYNIGFNVEQPQFQPNFGANLADNYQSLLGAWATGDFAHWGFQVLNTPKQNQLNPDAASIFQKAFGTDFISGKNPTAAAGSPGGAFAYGGPQNPTTQDQIIEDIYFSFQDGQMPGVLGVVVAMIESSFSPEARSPNGYMGLFQTKPGPTGKAVIHESQLKAAAAHPSDPVTKYYPSGSQIADAVGWFPGGKPPGVNNTTTDAHDIWLWAIDAQIGGLSGVGGNPAYAFNNFLASLNKAKKLVANLTQGTGSFGALVSGSLKFVGPDQGCDFTGTGSLHAIADGRITFVSTNSGWPGGGLLVLKLDKAVTRPAIRITATHVYYAEAIHPQVKTGQHIIKGQIVATMSSSYPGTEIGWAQNDAGSAYGTTSDGKGGNAAPYGTDFENYVRGA